jgi:hypothetical protein
MGELNIEFSHESTAWSFRQRIRSGTDFTDKAVRTAGGAAAEEVVAVRTPRQNGSGVAVQEGQR